MRSKFLDFYLCFFVVSSPPFGEVMLTTGGKVDLRRTGRRIVRRCVYFSCCNKIFINERYPSLTHGLMANRLVNMNITSKFD